MLWIFYRPQILSERSVICDRKLDYNKPDLYVSVCLSVADSVTQWSGGSIEQA